jgi:acyl-coenzyme A synthetase/AMP-(fatty) acid ligase/3-hydroxymyristoyl/3-hydroxydecanoyl-(acyl carrier protein) dehydratase
MHERLSLTEVASRPGLAHRPIAWRAGRLVTRAEFLADVAAWHAAFSSRPGTRFALYFDDGYDFAAALYGAWHAGKQVFLPGDAQPATTRQLMQQTDGCAGDLPGAITRLAATDAPRLEPLDLATTRLVVYTSGSSGEPSAIDKHLGQLDAEVRNLQAAFGGRFEGAGLPTIYSTVSHQHIYGLLFFTLWPLSAGRPFETARLVYPEQMAARLAERDSILVSSPAHLKRLPDTLAWAPARARLLSIFSSGGPLPPESADEALELLGHSPTEVYGSSETGGIGWRQRAQHGDRWRALPGVEWRLDDDLLCVRSAHLPDGTQWWETSDRAQKLEDGGFVLLGRVDRIVKIEEKRVSLTAIESTLAACPDIAEARALLVSDEAGMRLAVVAVPTAAGWEVMRSGGKRALNDRLRAVLLQTVERVALPRRFRYVSALPVNSQGKSTEALLSALFRPVMPQAQWQVRGAGAALLALDVTADLAVFDGHFPGAPVLPGVAQLHWAIAFARDCFAVSGEFVRAEALKFQRPVTPRVRLELSLRWAAEARQLNFEYQSDAGVHSSGRVVFGPH